MTGSQVRDIAIKLKQAGVPPDFGPDRSRLLIQALKALAKGQPVTGEQVDGIIADLKIPREDSLEFLGQVTERDAENNIIGLIGLSWNQSWAHRFYVNGQSLRTWCAWDTLFLPQLLQQTVTIESDSPVSKEKVRLTVTPEKVENCSPSGAVVSIVVIDPEQHDLSSVEAIWSNFCHQVYFFGSREEAQGWVGVRNDMVILSVEEAYDLGKQAFAGVLAYAEQVKA